MSLCLSVSVCQPFCITFCLSAYMCLSLPVCLSVFLSLSVCLSIHPLLFLSLLLMYCCLTIDSNADVLHTGRPMATSFNPSSKILYLAMGGSYTLSVTYSANPATMTSTWTHVYTNNTIDSRIPASSSIVSGSCNRIGVVSSADSYGQYICRVNNTIGFSDKVSFQLLQQSKCRCYQYLLNNHDNSIIIIKCVMHILT